MSQEKQEKDEKFWFMVKASAPPYGRFVVFLRWVVLKDASQRFVNLLRSPVKVERLYGLLGLWLTDPAEYEKALPGFKRDREIITEMVGDVEKERSVAEFAAEIGKGNYDVDIRNRLQKPLTIFARYAKKPN